MAVARLLSSANWSRTDLSAMMPWRRRCSGRWCDLVPERHVVGIERWEVGLAASRPELTTALASSSVPAPPSAQWLHTIASTPSSAQACCIAWISASVSAMKWLMATTAGTPNSSRSRYGGRDWPALLHRLDILLAEILLRDAAMHLQRAHGGDDHGGAGFRPALRHLMSKNFSAPRSAPKPASVTT